MANRQKFDITSRMIIVNLHKQYFSVREIAERVKRSKSVIGRIVKTYKNCGRVLAPNKTCRPRKTIAGPDRAIQHIALRNRFTTVQQILKK